jgi:PiT family inorganic phosphate transporter
VILASSYSGYPLSTTQVVSGGVLGAGLGKKLASVRWGVIGQMATAWTFTIPASAMLAGGAWKISAEFGTSTNAGSFVIAVLAALGAFGLYRLAQHNNISPDDLDRTA